MKGRRRKVGEWFVRIRLWFGFFRVDNQFSCTWVTSQSTFQCGGFTHAWFIYQSCKFSLSKRMAFYWRTYPMLNWRYKSCISKFVIPELWTTCVRCSHHSLPIPAYFNAFWAQFLKPRVSYVKHETNSRQFLFFDQIFQPIWKNRTNVSFDTQ